MNLQIGVISFPGSNCDQDIIHTLRALYADTLHENRVHAGTVYENTVHRLWYRDQPGRRFDLIVLPGGFSYGDYLRPGAIARFAPAMRALSEHHQRGGIILGICNGFQILCEAGFLEGALMRNHSLKHICRDTELKASPSNAFARQLKTDIAYNIPVSHSEGNYQATDDMVKSLQDHSQIAFRYQENPNGSVADIAAISDRRQQTLGMMPHPERAVDRLTGGTDGRIILEAILERCRSRH